VTVIFIVDSFRKSISKALADVDRAVIISHLDADGITSASIIASALEQRDTTYEMVFTRQIDDDILSREYDGDIIIYTDLGSGYIHEIARMGRRALVIDHHQPVVLSGSVGDVVQINPHLIGLDGAIDISGSGMAFMTAMALSEENGCLSPLAIVGAVGDMQDSRNRKLVGINREILQFGESLGLIRGEIDIRMFGRHTRSVVKMLEYSSEPFFPGLTGNEEMCTEFVKHVLSSHDIGRRWIDLTPVQRSEILLNLLEYCKRYRIRQDMLIGEVYTLLKEPEGTELRDAKEFATLLNATARYNNPMIGVKVCMGDRGDAFNDARILLQEHRQNLARGIELVQENGLRKLENIQYFDVGESIPDTIIGIIAGMLYSYIDRNMPVFAIAKAPNGTKISARGTWELVHSGLDLAEIMSQAAAAVGGRGGGHSIAAGANIPDDKVSEFLQIADQIVARQLKRNS